VDHEYGAARKLEEGKIDDPEQKKLLKADEKKFKRLAGMMTPMSKYYASEMCNRVAYDAVQVLGGSGYMKDYPVERHTRDARITTIYEGTSQLQVIAAVRGVCSGTADKYLQERQELLEGGCPEELRDLAEILQAGRSQLEQAVAFVKAQPGTEYMDLHGRKLVDVAIMLIVGHLFLHQGIAEPSWHDGFSPAQSADTSDNLADTMDTYRTVRSHKRVIARRYIQSNAVTLEMLCRQITTGDRSSMSDFDAIVGPVPAA
jgi:hypothetical protein